MLREQHLPFLRGRSQVHNAFLDSFATCLDPISPSLADPSDVSGLLAFRCFWVLLTFMQYPPPLWPIQFRQHSSQSFAGYRQRLGCRFPPVWQATRAAARRLQDIPAQ